MSNAPAGLPEFVTGPKPQKDQGLARAQDLQMAIGADGVWYYRNSPIERPALVKLFAGILRRESDGSYWLATPVERGRIEVKDAPFLAVSLRAEGAGLAQRLYFGLRYDIESDILAGPDHPIRVALDPKSGEPRPYLLVRPGLEALIGRAIYYQLAELAVARAGDVGDVIGIWSAGEFFPLSGAMAREADE